MNASTFPFCRNFLYRSWNSRFLHRTRNTSVELNSFRNWMIKLRDGYVLYVINMVVDVCTLVAEGWDRITVTFQTVIS